MIIVGFCSSTQPTRNCDRTDNTPIEHSSVTKDGTFDIGISSTRQISIAEVSPRQNGSFQFGVGEISTNQQSIFQRGAIQVSPTEVRTTKISSTKIRTQMSTTEIRQADISINHLSSLEVSPFQTSTREVSFPQISTIQVSSSQINTTQVGSTQLSISQINPGKIPLSSSIPFQQLFSIHNSTPTSINSYKDNSLNLWSTLLNPTFNINFQITDLPTGQLAEAQITNYD